MAHRFSQLVPLFPPKHHDSASRPGVPTHLLLFYRYNPASALQPIPKRLPQFRSPRGLQMRKKAGKFYADWRDEHAKRKMKAFPTKTGTLRFQNTRYNPAAAPRFLLPGSSTRPSKPQRSARDPGNASPEAPGRAMKLWRERRSSSRGIHDRRTGLGHRRSASR